MGRQIDGWIDRYVLVDYRKGQDLNINREICRYMVCYGQLDEKIDGQIDGQIDGYMDRYYVLVGYVKVQNLNANRGIGKNINHGTPLSVFIANQDIFI